MPLTAIFDGANWLPANVQVSESAPAAPEDDPDLDGQVWFVVSTASSTVTGMFVSYGGAWMTVPI